MFQSAAVVVAALGAAASSAQVPAAPAAAAIVKAAPSPNPFADRLPNLVVRTHEGKNVRFYDDLIKGKIVMINFMYSTCKGR